MPDIKVDLAGLKLNNPTILASGIMGSDKASLSKVASNGAGAVTIKSITLESRPGHPNPTVVQVESGFLNAVGYSNMGLENAKVEFAGVSGVGAPAIASIVAKDVEEFRVLARELSALEFSAIEAVLSCPHTPGLGLLAGHGSPEATYEIARAVKAAANVPVIIKLSPNVPAVGDVAKAALRAGASIINMGNSLGPGMVIDAGSAKPVLDFKVGGMSGPAIKPVTLRCVYDVYAATEGRIPIIGTGGVTKGLDAVEMVMAGASAVGVGTGVYYRGLGVFKSICDEITDYLETRGVKRLRDLVGVAHG
jgi:dihydroorotate dehydrogenase (NAD+) catalytic subunit